MKARAKEYRDQMCSITNAEWDAHTDQEWCDWCGAWNTYVKQGGVRPNNRPPVQMKKKDISQNVFSEELCERIRKKLKVTEKELSNRDIKKTIILSNKLYDRYEH